jgi:hypothetical protein
MGLDAKLHDEKPLGKAVADPGVDSLCRRAEDRRNVPHRQGYSRGRGGECNLRACEPLLVIDWSLARSKTSASLSSAVAASASPLRMSRAAVRVR